MNEETVLVVFVGASIGVSFVTTEVSASGDTEPWVLEAKLSMLEIHMWCDSCLVLTYLLAVRAN